MKDIVFKNLTKKFGRVATHNSIEAVKYKYEQGLISEKDIKEIDKYKGTYHEFLKEHNVSIKSIAERLFIEFDFEYDFDGTHVCYTFKADRNILIELVFDILDRDYSAYTTGGFIDPTTHVLIHTFMKEHGWFDDLDDDFVNILELNNKEITD